MLQTDDLANFWFCLHSDCRNRMMGPYDSKKVFSDHSDHTDEKNFTNFMDSHKRLSDMVEKGDLKSPQSLEQEVGKLVEELLKKLTLYLGSLKDTLIKKIKIGINHRYKLYEALLTKNKQVFLTLKEQIGELAQVEEYIKLYNSLRQQARNSFSMLEQHLPQEPNDQVSVPQPFDWRWETGYNCAIKGKMVNGMGMAETNCLISPSFKANESRAIRLRYLVNKIIYNVQLVDVSTRTSKGLNGRVQKNQGTYAFGSSYYLDRDTDWMDDNKYPVERLIRKCLKSEEVNLVYDGSTQKVTLHNLTSQASFSLNVNYQPETILQFAVNVSYPSDWFEILS